MLGVLRAVGFEQTAVLGEIHQDIGQDRVAIGIELGSGPTTLGRTRVTRGEYQFTRLRSALGKAEILGRMRRMAADIDAQERHVPVVAGVIEVVDIAAEKGGLLARRHDQAHVVEAAVFIHPVLPAVIQRNHLTQPLFRLAADAGLLQVRRFGLFHTIEGRPLPARGGAPHLRGDVGHRDQLLHLHRREAQFLFIGRGIEAVTHQIPLGSGEVLQVVHNTMVIGKYQAAGRDERAGATFGEAYRGQLNLADPSLRRREPETRLERFHRQVVQRPHARTGHGDGHGQGHTAKNQQQAFHQEI